MPIDPKFLKPYSPSDVENKIYTLWENSGYFNPDTCIKNEITKADAPYFSMVLPPPNVTGKLHLGHALEQSLQDLTTRFKRMRGERTLWVPGTDHAAIATSSKFEKELYKKSGKTRHDFDRQTFFNMVNEYAMNFQREIRTQCRVLGSSLDWSRESFTLDEKRSHSVFEAFKILFDLGLVYRGYRVINWDPKGQTTVSDDEVNHEETSGILYTFRYSKDFPILISTTRPETKLGDTAVAVNPDDKRYSEHIGKVFNVNFAGQDLIIKIIADKSIDIDYGTGAVGITPAHSMIDYEIALRHGLDTKVVINEFAKMVNVPENFLGKKTIEARAMVTDWLESNGLLQKNEVVTINISKAERTGGTIEPLPKLQWFIDINKEFIIKKSKITGIDSGSKTTLKKLMTNSVSEGQITVVPDRCRKIYFNWIDNLNDWCISRQILYGHRIPVWYSGDKIEVSRKSPGDEWAQDEDTLDTWFSSALWTFSTLGWPEKSLDLDNYHPTSLINPGRDIIFFWVARMIMMSGVLLGDIPFKTAYLHGVVKNKDGIKFSKSLNNSIEIETITSKYGADALRMSLVVGIGPGNDTQFDEQKVKAYKLFANKIWNLSRFVITTIEDIDIDDKTPLLDYHQKYLDEFILLSNEITNEIEGYKSYYSSEKLYHYIWHTFADIIVEECKAKIMEGTNAEKLSSQLLISRIMSDCLKLLHPFMPFITEEIWQSSPWIKKPFLMVEEWPVK